MRILHLEGTYVPTKVEDHVKYFFDIENLGYEISLSWLSARDQPLHPL